MSYLGLARKWRSQTFADLVGQGHIAKTISNAIRLNRIGHGYLFTGTRGIGKTSAARIFSKALRCTNPPEPGLSCNQCEDCLQIAEGRSVDVLEIDGASNNGVDAVREIRENAKYLPSHGKYKIYIIDEVHMLTTAAFNALLKTLEEPPAHVIFIFATTDPQKIPATVLSRCQRFDFKRISEKDLKDRLSFICAQEKVEIDEAALNILTRESEGSMRDAISLLDQILSTSSTRITMEELQSALGLIDRKVILDCVAAIIKKQPKEALEALGKVYLHGFDLKQFGREILRVIRHTMVASLLSKNASGFEISKYLDLSDTEFKEVQELCTHRSSDELDLIFRVLSHGLEELGRSQTAKLLFDVLLMKVSTFTSLVKVADYKPGVTTTSSAPTRIDSIAVAMPPSPTFSTNVASAAVATAAPSFEAPQNLLQWWKSVVSQVKAKKPLVGSLLENFSLEKFQKETSSLLLTLGYSKDHAFYKEQLASKAYQELIIQIMRAITGMPTRFEFKEVQKNQSIAALEKEQKTNIMEMKRKTVLETEASQATEKLLGAKLEKLEIF